MIMEPNRNQLDLTVSLRTHLAGDVSQFINAVIGGDCSLAKKLISLIYDQKFSLYITQEITKAKAYCKERYDKEPNKRYGLLASSKAHGLKTYGIYNDYNSTNDVDFGQWYNNPPGKIGSCCNFKSVVTEFGCQGLELDMPIICWGDDVLWKDGQWSLNGNLDDVKRDYRMNSYRVLLSRGRDGCIIFIPPEPKYQGTYDMLTDLGIKILD